MRAFRDLLAQHAGETTSSRRQFPHVSCRDTRGTWSGKHHPRVHKGLLDCVRPQPPPWLLAAVVTRVMLAAVGAVGTIGSAPYRDERARTRKIATRARLSTMLKPCVSGAAPCGRVSGVRAGRPDRIVGHGGLQSVDARLRSWSSRHGQVVAGQHVVQPPRRPGRQCLSAASRGRRQSTAAPRRCRAPTAAVRGSRQLSCDEHRGERGGWDTGDCRSTASLARPSAVTYHQGSRAFSAIRARTRSPPALPSISSFMALPSRLTDDEGFPVSSPHADQLEDQPNPCLATFILSTRT